MAASTVDECTSPVDSNVSMGGKPLHATSLGKWNKTGEAMEMAKKRQVWMFIGGTQRTCAKTLHKGNVARARTMEEIPSMIAAWNLVNPCAREAPED